MAEALYRKYRPQVFEDVVGQEPIERTLKNALRQDKVSHAYLFCGPRGTGKTTTARLLAKALLCQSGPTPDPDGTCEDCQLIAEGAHPDVYELDAASRTGVENVREEIISRVQFAPTRGRYKVYIIDEVHMLSTAAFNALLKTLEEPPGHVVFILCTTDPQKVPETIHSRCQRFDFRRIAPESMVSRLGAICIAEGVEFEGEALDLVAQRADGGLRNALTSLEQIIAFEDGKVTLAGAERLLGSIDSTDLAEIMVHVGRRDIASCFRWTAAYVETGADLAQFVRDMAEHARNLYVMALVGDDAELEVSETARRQLTSELQWFGADRAGRLLGVLGDLSAELKTSSNPRLAFEIALTRMVRPDSDLTLESLAERIEALESGYSSVAHVLPGEPLVASAGREPDVPGADAGPPADAPDAGGGSPAGARFAHPASEAGQAQAAAADGAANPSDSHPPQDAADGAGRAERAPMGDLPRQETASGLPGAGGQGASDALSALANPATLQRVWQAALVTLKKQKQAHGVLFIGAKARFDSDAGMVKVLFPAENTFAFNAVQKPDVQDALAAALRKAFGSGIPFAYEQAGSPVASGATAAAVAVSAIAAAGRADPQPAPLVSQGTASKGSEAPNRVLRENLAQGDVAGGGAPQPEAGGGAPQPEAAPFEPGRAPRPQSGSSYDEVPYDEVPYEELGYDDGGSYDQSPYGQVGGSIPASVGAASPGASPDAGVSDAPPDAQSASSPAWQDEGASGGNLGDIEAMLQAGFGDSVVLSEVEEQAEMESEMEL